MHYILGSWIYRVLRITFRGIGLAMSKENNSVSVSGIPVRREKSLPIKNHVCHFISPECEYAIDNRTSQELLLMIPVI